MRPKDEPEFTADIKARFSQLGGPAKGMVLTVLYDPNDHSKVVLDQSASGGLETAIGTMLSKSSAVAGNPALGDSLADLMRAAVTDPTGFHKQMQEQAATNPLFVNLSGQQPAHQDPVDQLAKLADLLDRGVLTKEEFETQKRRILNEDA